MMMDVKKSANSKYSDEISEREAQEVSKDELISKKFDQSIAQNSCKSNHEYDVNQMTMEHLRKSLACVGKNPVEPFTFLTKIDECFQTSNAPTTDLPTISHLTDIDIQLETLSRRIQLNKSLLQQTNESVKKFNSSVEKQLVHKINDGNDKSTSEEEDKSSIDEMQRTLTAAVSTLSRMNDLVNDKSEIILK